MPADGPHALRHTTTTASPDWTANRRERCIVAVMAPVLASRSDRMPAPGPLIGRAVTFRLRPAAAPSAGHRPQTAPSPAPGAGSGLLGRRAEQHGLVALRDATISWTAASTRIPCPA